jgi:hypothetical protein
MRQPGSLRAEDQRLRQAAAPRPAPNRETNPFFAGLQKVVDSPFVQYGSMVSPALMGATLPLRTGNAFRNVQQGRGGLDDYLTFGEVALGPLGLVGKGAASAVKGAAAASRFAPPPTQLKALEAKAAALRKARRRDPIIKAGQALKGADKFAPGYKYLEKVLQKPRVTHMTSLEGLEGIVDSGGALKTAVGDAVKRGGRSHFDLAHRASLIPDDPIYGAFLKGNPNKVYEVTRGGAQGMAKSATRLSPDTPDTPLLGYGDIGLNFNRQASRKSTATVGDSVGWAPVDKTTGHFGGKPNEKVKFLSPSRLKPGATAAEIRKAAIRADAEDLRTPFWDTAFPYLEAQMPKEFATLKNVKSISVGSPQQAARAKEILRRAGIDKPVVVRKRVTPKRTPGEVAIDTIDNVIYKRKLKLDARSRALHQRIQKLQDELGIKPFEPEA